MSIPAGWVQTTIGEVVDFQGGTQPPKSEFVYEAKPGYVRLVQIRDFRSDEYKTYIPSSLARNSFGRDDVMIGRYGPPVFQILRGLDGAYNVALIKATPDLNRMSKDFLYLVLQQEPLFNLIDGLSRRSAGQAGVDMDALRSFPLLLPPPPVQDFIADRVNLLNQGIRQLTDLTSAKLRFKQGTMQQLLTGRLRFPEFKSEQMGKRAIGSFLTLCGRPVTRPASAYTALGLRSHGKGTFVRQVEDPNQVQMDTLYQVRENDLIVNITFAWEGAIAIASKDDESSLVSHRFPTFVVDDKIVSPEFLRHVIITPPFVFKLGLVSPGGAGRNRVMNKKDFLKIEIALPSLNEQRKIAKLLNAMDREIELLRKQLDLLKLQKKGLMQKLLIGQVRVKLPKGTK